MALDPTHIAATTSAIATVIFSKAIEKGGEHIGDAVYQKIGNVVGAIKEKLQQQGSVDTLTEAQENPSEQNISQFTQELMGLMLEDNEFAEDLENSLAIFSQNSEVQEIIEKGSIKIDLSSHQPLSVAHFEDVTVSEAVTTKQSLSIEDALNEK